MIFSSDMRACFSLLRAVAEEERGPQAWPITEAPRSPHWSLFWLCPSLCCKTQVAKGGKDPHAGRGEEAGRGCGGGKRLPEVGIGFGSLFPQSGAGPRVTVLLVPANLNPRQAWPALGMPGVRGGAERGGGCS